MSRKWIRGGFQHFPPFGGEKMKRIVNMVLDRETKGALRYAEMQDEAQENMFNTLYIRKVAFKGEKPNQIEVTVEY
jgi:hypothetical protein